MNEKDMKNIIEAVVRDLGDDVSGITLDMALALAKAVREKAAEIGVNAVVAIADRGANPVLVQCMDNAYIASYDIALNKSYTSVALKMPTWKLSELAKPGNSLYGIQHTNGGKIVIFGGGEPLCNRKGEIIGALGVSGGSESEDTALAAYGKEIFEKG
jgi:uncharacterized protein GlcG (DUF336 family)